MLGCGGGGGGGGGQFLTEARLTFRSEYAAEMILNTWVFSTTSRREEKGLWLRLLLQYYMD